MTVNTDIRDDFTEHDVHLRRVDGGVRRAIEKKLAAMQQRLKGLILTIDPNGAKQKAARDRRIKKLEQESRTLIRETYREINTMVNADLRRIAKAESAFTVAAIEDNLP